MSSEGEVQGLVIDISGGWVKSGFAGDDAPRSDVNLSHLITDFESTFAKIAHGELRIDPSEHSILLITSGKDFIRENLYSLCSVLFNKFHAPEVYIASAPLLALYSSQRETGVTIYVEQDIIEVSAYYEGNLTGGVVKHGHYTGKDAVNNNDVLYQADSICEAVKQCMDSCEKSLHEVLSGNIVMAGRLDNNTPLPAGCEKLLSEKLTSALGVPVNIGPKESNEIMYRSWRGGSILISLGIFKQTWISKEEYDECGVGIIDEKYFSK
ncbi:hypothetical protein ACOZB2_22845 [Pantoea endophytica]|uniref:Actin-like protein N-terminal domain-containing protein n=1 Tax=Pantoea sp. BJ2 TaxID=3141322 RepID=A0AAU7U3V9_9GAMM